MSQSLAKIYVHIVFSTKNRHNIIGKDINDELYNYIGGICKRLECYPVKVGGYYNHIHIFMHFIKESYTNKIYRRSKEKFIKMDQR